MRVFLAICLMLLGLAPANAQYLGNYTVNPTLPPAPPQPPGTFSNPFGSTSNSPQLYDSQGNFHGNLNSNQFDPDSVANHLAGTAANFHPTASIILSVRAASSHLTVPTISSDKE